jgi:hypothetical protein
LIPDKSANLESISDEIVLSHSNGAIVDFLSTPITNEKLGASHLYLNLVLIASFLHDDTQHYN